MVRPSDCPDGIRQRRGEERMGDRAERGSRRERRAVVPLAGIQRHAENGSRAPEESIEQHPLLVGQLVIGGPECGRLIGRAFLSGRGRPDRQDERAAKN